MLANNIEQLEKDLGLPNPVQQEDGGTWRLPIDNGVISISDIDPGFYLYTTLVDLPQGVIENLMVLIGTCNLFGQRTDGAVIGLEENGKKLTLSMAVAEDVDYERFYNHCEDFINQMDYWKEKVGSWDESEGAFFE